MADLQPKLRVLIVDDDPICAAILESHLQTAGHEVIVSPSATSAVRLMSQQPFQLIIIDWVMPEITGLDLCRWIRRQSFSHPMHLVILTAHSDRDRLVEAFSAGADDFLSKPLHEAELLARLRAWERFLKLQLDLAAQHADAVRLNEELAEANTLLSRLAIQDDLTMLPNRRAATARLQEQWSFAERYAQPFACALVDVDRFKEINDTFGHAAGDDVLCCVSATLADCCRACDTVFRMGGDEFLILLPNADLAAGEVCAERCRAAIADLVVTTMQEQLRCTISIGLAARTSQMQTPDDLLRAADDALYAAKRSGRNSLNVTTGNFTYRRHVG